ncbi:MAG: DUF370 domain-containing protein [Oscillospiraceae bacterium]|nr:DUF370 domain-containing protein [Oscillospiraceae bacterium]
MYLHLGNDVAVRTKEVIGIFDFDYCSVDKRTRLFLSKAQKNGEVVNVTKELPKSFIVTADGEEKKVYITNVSPATLAKRGERDRVIEE